MGRGGPTPSYMVASQDGENGLIGCVDTGEFVQTSFKVLHLVETGDGDKMSTEETQQNVNNHRDEEEIANDTREYRFSKDEKVIQSSNADDFNNNACFGSVEQDESNIKSAFEHVDVISKKTHLGASKIRSQTNLNNNSGGEPIEEGFTVQCNNASKSPGGKTMCDSKGNLQNKPREVKFSASVLEQDEQGVKDGADGTEGCDVSSLRDDTTDYADDLILGMTENSYLDAIPVTSKNEEECQKEIYESNVMPMPPFYMDDARHARAAYTDDTDIESVEDDDMSAENTKFEPPASFNLDTIIAKIDATISSDSHVTENNGQTAFTHNKFRGEKGLNYPEEEKPQIGSRFGYLNNTTIDESMTSSVGSFNTGESKRGGLRSSGASSRSRNRVSFKIDTPRDDIQDKDEDELRLASFSVRKTLHGVNSQSYVERSGSVDTSIQHKVTITPGADYDNIDVEHLSDGTCLKTMVNSPIMDEGMPRDEESFTEANCRSTTEEISLHRMSSVESLPDDIEGAEGACPAIKHLKTNAIESTGYPTRHQQGMSQEQNAWGRSSKDLSAYANEFEDLSSVCSYQVDKLKRENGFEGSQNIHKSNDQATGVVNVLVQEGETVYWPQGSPREGEGREKIIPSPESSVNAPSLELDSASTRSRNGGYEIWVMPKDGSGSQCQGMASKVIIVENDSGSGSQEQEQESSSRDNTSRLQLSLSQISQFEKDNIDRSTFNCPANHCNKTFENAKYKDPVCNKRNTPYGEVERTDMALCIGDGSSKNKDGSDENRCLFESTACAMRSPGVAMEQAPQREQGSPLLSRPKSRPRSASQSRKHPLGLSPERYRRSPDVGLVKHSVGGARTTNSDIPNGAFDKRGITDNAQVQIINLKDLKGSNYTIDSDSKVIPRAAKETSGAQNGESHVDDLLSGSSQQSLYDDSGNTEDAATASRYTRSSSSCSQADGDDQDDQKTMATTIESFDSNSEEEMNGVSSVEQDRASACFVKETSVQASQKGAIHDGASNNKADILSKEIIENDEVRKIISPTPIHNTDTIRNTPKQNENQWFGYRKQFKELFPSSESSCEDGGKIVVEDSPKPENNRIGSLALNTSNIVDTKVNNNTADPPIRDASPVCEVEREASLEEAASSTTHSLSNVGDSSRQSFSSVSDHDCVKQSNDKDGWFSYRKQYPELFPSASDCAMKKTKKSKQKRKSSKVKNTPKSSESKTSSDLGKMIPQQISKIMERNENKSEKTEGDDLNKKYKPIVKTNSCSETDNNKESNSKKTKALEFKEEENNDPVQQLPLKIDGKVSAANSSRKSEPHNKLLCEQSKQSSSKTKVSLEKETILNHSHTDILDNKESKLNLSHSQLEEAAKTSISKHSVGGRKVRKTSSDKILEADKPHILTNDPNIDENNDEESASDGPEKGDPLWFHYRKRWPDLFPGKKEKGKSSDHKPCLSYTNRYRLAMLKQNSRDKSRPEISNDISPTHGSCGGSSVSPSPGMGDIVDGDEARHNKMKKKRKLPAINPIKDGILGVILKDRSPRPRPQASLVFQSASNHSNSGRLSPLLHSSQQDDDFSSRSNLPPPSPRAPNKLRERSLSRSRRARRAIRPRPIEEPEAGEIGDSSRPNSRASPLPPRLPRLPELHATPPPPNTESQTSVSSGSQSFSLTSEQRSRSPRSRRTHHSNCETRQLIGPDGSPRVISISGLIQPSVLPSIADESGEGALLDQVIEEEGVITKEDLNKPTARRGRESPLVGLGDAEIGLLANAAEEKGGADHDLMSDLLKPPPESHNGLPPGANVDATIYTARVSGARVSGDRVSGDKSTTSRATTDWSARDSYSSGAQFLKHEIPRKEEKQTISEDIYAMKVKAKVEMLSENVIETWDKALDQSVHIVRAGKYRPNRVSQLSHGHSELDASKLHRLHHLEQLQMEAAKQIRAEEMRKRHEQNKSVYRLTMPSTADMNVFKPQSERESRVSKTSELDRKRALKENNIKHRPRKESANQALKMLRKVLTYKGQTAKRSTKASKPNIASQKQTLGDIARAQSDQSEVKQPNRTLSEPDTQARSKMLAAGHYDRQKNVISVVVKSAKEISNLADGDNQLNLKVSVYRPNKSKAAKVQESNQEGAGTSDSQIPIKRVRLSHPPPKPAPILARNIVELRAINPPFNCTMSAEANKRYNSVYGNRRVY